MSRLHYHLAAVYFCALGAAGGWVPYLSLFLGESGWSGRAIGAVLGALPLTRILMTPLWSLLADHLRKGSLLLKAASLVAAVIAVLTVSFPFSPLALGVMLALFSGVRGPIGPLLDTLVVRVLEREGRDVRDYGRLRLWGSAGFLLVAALAAVVADSSGSPVAPLRVGAALWVGAAIFTLALPKEGEARLAPVLPALKGLAAEPFLLPLVAGLTLHGMSLSVYDSLLSVHLKALGLPVTWTSACITAGVLVEIGVMAGGRATLTRWSASSLLIFSAAMGVIRWPLTALLTSPLALVAVQTLHGVTFAVFWIASVEILRVRTPDAIRASAQGLLTTTAYGLGPLLCGVAASLWMDPIGAKGLFLLGGLASGAAALLFLAAARRSA